MKFRVYRFNQPMQEFPTVFEMIAAGFTFTGLTPFDKTPLRPELRGQPMFKELVGPMWDGSAEALRYEDWKTCNILSAG